MNIRKGRVTDKESFVSLFSLLLMCFPLTAAQRGENSYKIQLWSVQQNAGRVRTERGPHAKRYAVDHGGVDPVGEWLRG